MTEYCYSIDEEEYHGSYGTREEAVEAAQEDLAPDVEPGEHDVWTAETAPAIEYLKRDQWIVENLIERLDESLHDEISADDALIEMSEEKREELRQIILKFLEEHATFSRYGVTKVERHTVVIEGDPDA